MLGAMNTDTNTMLVIIFDNDHAPGVGDGVFYLASHHFLTSALPKKP